MSRLAGIARLLMVALVLAGPAALPGWCAEEPVVQKFAGADGWEDPRPAPSDDHLAGWQGAWNLVFSDTKVPWATSQLLVDRFQVTPVKDVYPRVEAAARISLPRGWENEATHFPLVQETIQYDWNARERVSRIHSLEFSLAVNRKEEGKQVWRFVCYRLQDDPRLVGVCTLDGGETWGFLGEPVK